MSEGYIAITNKTVSVKRYTNESVMIIGDTHLPYMHPDGLAFYQWVQEQISPERIFHTGDLSDQYGFSRFGKIPEADSLPTELKQIRKGVQDLGGLFPRMTIISSNHDDRLYNKGMVAGIPKHLIRPYAEVISCEGFDWKWVQDYTITLPDRSNLYLAHTKAGTTLSLAKSLGMHVAVGHHHNQQGIQYFTSPLKKVFAVDVGCMVDDTHYAFLYNKGTVGRPTLGCAAILDSKPYLFTMDLSGSGRWKKPLKVA